MKKRGAAGMWEIIGSLILGLMVLAIFLNFIFNEGINGISGEKEACWQSVQVRALMPEIKKGGIGIAEFKSQYPLKCKTQVVEIGEAEVKDVKAVQEEIAGMMAECWALYGKGDFNIFPSNLYSTRSVCVPCARIHLTNEAKRYMRNENINISIKDALDLKMNEGFSYYAYLENSGKSFPAFNPASSGRFDLSGEDFFVDEDNKVPAIFKNRLTGGVDDGRGVVLSVDISPVSLPEFLNPDKGDLLINYGVITSPKKGEMGDYIPYLFYFQDGQVSNPLEEVEKQLVDGPLWKNENLCEGWEGITG